MRNSRWSSIIVALAGAAALTFAQDWRAEAAEGGDTPVAFEICAAILPWVNKLASGGDWRQNQALVRGINVDAGELVHPALQGMKL